MKIEKKEMNKISKILKEIEYNPINNEYEIIFPIEMKRDKDFDGIELSLVNNKFGSEKMPEPALLLSSESDSKGKITTNTSLCFCDVLYARKFDIILYCELLNINLNKKTKETLEGLECYLISKSNILTSFKF